MSDGFEDYRVIDKELEEIGASTFKNAPFTGWSQVGNHFESHLSRYNGAYRESDYFYQGNRTFQISARIDLSRLLAFHKQEKFINEKEIRLLTYNPFDTFHEKMKFSKFDYRLENGRNRFTKYFDYPLWVDNSSNMLKSVSPEIDRTSKFNEQYFEDKPKIIIKDIRVGYNAGLNYQEFSTFREEIETIMAYNYGYHIKVSQDLIQPNRK